MVARRRSIVAAALVLAALSAAHSWALDYRGDDGAITFQYVKNVLAGHGPVYVVGERVEGYSNFLWVVLLSLTTWLTRIDVASLAPVFGVALSAVSVWLTHRIAVRLHGWSPKSLLAPALLAVATPFAVWARSGLEAPLFAAVTLAAVAARLRAPANLTAVGVWLGLAAIARPEGALFAVLAAGCELAAATHARDPLERSSILDAASRLRHAARLLLPVAALVLPHLAFRRLYYGEWVPNTYFAKVDFGWSVVLRGVEYVSQYAELVSFVPYVLLVVGAALALRDRRLAYPALFTLGYAVWVVSVGGDGLVMFRFVAHVLPLACLLVAEGAFRVAAELECALAALESPRYGIGVREAKSGARTTSRLSLGLLGAILVVGQGWPSALLLMEPSWPWVHDDASGLWFPDAERGWLWFDRYFAERVEMAGRYFDAHAAPNALVAANPGGIAFHMRQPVLDMLGLNDRVLARRGRGGTGRAGHERGDGAYILSRAPEYVALANVAVLQFPLDDAGVARRLYLRSEFELWALPEFHAAYERVVVGLASSGPLRYFTFYRRRHPSAGSP
jgi:arabinofuranosyltransferase